MVRWLHQNERYESREPPRKYRTGCIFSRSQKTTAPVIASCFTTRQSKLPHPSVRSGIRSISVSSDTRSRNHTSNCPIADSMSKMWPTTPSRNTTCIPLLRDQNFSSSCGRVEKCAFACRIWVAVAGAETTTLWKCFSSAAITSSVVIATSVTSPTPPMGRRIPSPFRGCLR